MTYRDDTHSQAAALPTLAEFNRSAPPYEDKASRPAGVRCHACASAGISVEMRIGLVDAVYSQDYVAVACPRCLMSGHRRCSPGGYKAWLKMRGDDEYLLASDEDPADWRSEDGKDE